jgi:hypothetical protein
MTTTTRKDARPGTLHLPTKKDKAPPAPAKIAAPAPMKPVAIPKALHADRSAIESNVDVGCDLAPEHRKGPPRIKQALNELARSLVELTRDVPLEPRDTRSLRLALAVVELAPECPPALISNALRAYALGASEADRVAAHELQHAVFGCVNNARLIRFKAMIESAIAVVEQRRMEGAREQ